MKLFRIWYRTNDGESDFTECTARDEVSARLWFRTHWTEWIESIEVAEYSLL